MLQIVHGTFSAVFRTCNKRLSRNERFTDTKARNVCMGTNLAENEVHVR